MSAKPELESDPPGRLASHFHGHDASVHGSRWQALWEEAYTPWDRGQPSPALIELLEERKDLVGECWTVDPAHGKRRKRALVPGCGRGYDVLILSAFGYDAYGLDVSSAAMKAAKDYEKLKSGDDVYKARGLGGKGEVHWMTADFFKDDFLKEIGGDGTFDLLFDYTVRFSILSRYVAWVLISASSCQRSQSLSAQSGLVV
jgi:methyl halide transferase